MRTTTRFLLLLMLAQTGSTAPAWAQVDGVKHVVVIGVDGMSPDGVQKATTPALNRLIEGGAYSMHARAVLPSSSSPNWASMIMGAGPEEHGITSNDWRRDDFVLPSTAYAEDGYFPTIFYLLRQARPDAGIAAVYDWGGFGNLFAHETVDHAIDADGPEATVEAAVRLFAEDQPTLTFVHLDHVDAAGHGAGHGTDAYYAAVERADSLIGRLVSGLEDAGMADSTLVLVTSDHGGEGTGHGGETLAQMEIPWIVYGPGVAAGRELTVPISTFDTAATVAYALGLEPPEAWIARPVRSAFASENGEGASEGSAYVPAPRISPRGGLFVDASATVTLAVDHEEAEIRYTLDGSAPTSASPRYEAPIALQEAGTLKARAFGPRRTSGQEAASDVSAATYRFATSGSGRGLTYHYYEGEGWTRLPDFDALAPVRTGRALEASLEGVAHRADQFAVRFTGQIEIAEPGRYTFYTVSDDGSRLYLNGEQLVDNDGSHGPTVERGSLGLEAGRHDLVVTYFDEGGGQSLEVWYRGPGVPKQVVPAAVLYPDVRKGERLRRGRAISDHGAAYEPLKRDGC